MKNKLYYLASPYSHADSEIKKMRAEAVTKSAVDLLKLGVFVFAPISYNEPWEKYNLPGDWNFWCEFDKTFVSRCDGGIIVLMLDGWDKSIGVTAEIEYAKSIGLPVHYATQKQIESGDLSFINAKPSKQDRMFCSYSKF
jgi:hypothetical protein